MKRHRLFKRLQISLLATFTALGVISSPKALGQETTATLVGLGNGDIFFSRYYYGLGFAGIIKMAVGDDVADAFCVDYYLPIGLGDTLQIGGPLTDINNDVDWCSVNHILNRYQPNSNLEAAAMQCAIWYFVSAPLGPYSGSGGMYQFMTDSSYFFPYDAYSLRYGPQLRQRAMAMINDVPTNVSGDCLARFPQAVELTPEVVDVRNCDRQDVLMTATVYDQYGHPMPDVDLRVVTENGQLSPAPVQKGGRPNAVDPCSSWTPGSTEATGITDEAGEIHFLFSACGITDKPLITAYAEGRYGTLFFDVNQQLQTLSTLSLVPYSISDLSMILCRDRMVPEGAEGCGHGFWKTHLGAWRTYLPKDPVTDVFGVPPGSGRPENDTLLDALEYLGGNSTDGAERLVLMQAVAAILNAVHPDVDFAFTEHEVLEAVADAFASGDRTVLIALADTLDQANNLGCAQ